MDSLRKLIILFFIISYHFCSAQSVEQQIDSFYTLIENETIDSLKNLHYYYVSLLQLYSEPLQAIESSKKGLAISKKIKAHDWTEAHYTTMINTHLYYGSPGDTLLKYIQLLEEHTRTNSKEKDLVNTY